MKKRQRPEGVFYILAGLALLVLGAIKIYGSDTMSFYLGTIECGLAMLCTMIFAVRQIGVQFKADEQKPKKRNAIISAIICLIFPPLSVFYIYWFWILFRKYCANTGKRITVRALNDETPQLCLLAGVTVLLSVAVLTHASIVNPVEARGTESAPQEQRDPLL